MSKNSKKLNPNSLCQLVSNKDWIFIEFFILISSCHFYKEKCNIRHWDLDAHILPNFIIVSFQFLKFFDTLRKMGRKSFGNCLQNNPIKLNNSWMLQRFIQGHNERKNLTDSNTKRNLCYFLLIKEIDSSFSATLLEIAYSFNSSFISQLYPFSNSHIKQRSASCHLLPFMTTIQSSS